MERMLSNEKAYSNERMRTWEIMSVFVGVSCYAVFLSPGDMWRDSLWKKQYHHLKQKQWLSVALVPCWVGLLLGGDIQHIWNVWLPSHYLLERADWVIDEHHQPMFRTQNRLEPITYDTVLPSLNSWNARHFPELYMKLWTLQPF